MSPRSRSVIAASAALTAALLSLFALSASPALAHGDDEHSGHGGSTKPLPADADRCDLGFNSKAYNDIVRQGKVNDPFYAGTRFRNIFMQPMTVQQMFAPGGFSLGKATYGWIASEEMYNGRKKMGHLNHSLVDPWNGMTDPVQCNKLKKLLQDTRAYAAKYPKLKDAFADGFEFITPWFAGAGAHIGKWEDYDDKIVPGHPEVLIYDGNSPESNVVGAMYSVMSDTEPTSMTPGGNDVWHQHKGLCWTSDKKQLERVGLQPGTKVVIGGEAATKTWCKDIWKGQVEEMASLWMMHMWLVPGCASNYGVFSHDLQYLTFRNYMNTKPKPGCGTGLLPSAPLSGFETNELNVPGKLTNYRSSKLSWTEPTGSASGAVAAEVADHPGSAHVDGEAHLAGNLITEDGFSGPTGSWPVSIERELDGRIHGTVTTPTGTVATFTEGTAAKTDQGVSLTAAATTPAGTTVQLSIEFADSGLRSFFLDPPASAAETLAIHHPAHGHDHAVGPVTYALASHPGENHVGEEHLFGSATTKDTFTGDAGVWTVSFTKNTTTHAIKGYLKNPTTATPQKTFNFTVSDHHDSDECAGGVHVNAIGSEALTPDDPQNPEFIICDPAVTTFFADHDHSGTTPTTPTPTTPVPTTPDGHDHTH